MLPNMSLMGTLSNFLKQSIIVRKGSLAFERKPLSIAMVQHNGHVNDKGTKSERKHIKRMGISRIF